MRLAKARVRKYRSIRDSGLFEVEEIKTILVGPNESGKTALLQALHRLNPPPETPGFDFLRDYPRSELNDIDSGKVNPSDVTVVEGHFKLDANEQKHLEELDPAFEDCTYVFDRKLDNSWSHRIDGGPEVPTYKAVKPDLSKVSKYADKHHQPTEENLEAVKPSDALKGIVEEWTPTTRLTSTKAKALEEWLEGVTDLVADGENVEEEEQRLESLTRMVGTSSIRARAVQHLQSKLPVFVYYSNYFRVHPRIHLEHLADRVEQNLLDDEAYDFGNLCLLQLLGFTPRELSDLGKPTAPVANDSEALKAYQDQLDRRKYRLNAASVQLTQSIREVWNPDPKKAEADKLRIDVDQQYLKVVVEDDLGVEIELDQRSEGYQWLVSFFVVFFAQTVDELKNAILLLDEPGLSLHGLKQREFRVTVSKLGKDNQLLYTTHSPFLVGPDELDMVRVLEMTDRKVGTKVHTMVSAGDSAALLPLQEALGYDLAQSLFTQQRNLVLEGLTDYWYVEATSHLLREAGLADLNEKIALIPAHGAGKVVYFATILHANELKVAALLDSDAAGDSAANQDTLVHTLGNKGILRTKDYYSGPASKVEVEDLLRETLIQVAKADLAWDVATVATKQKTRPIVEVFEDEIGADFSKYKLAKAYIRWSRGHEAGDLGSDEAQAWIGLINAINKSVK